MHTYLQCEYIMIFMYAYSYIMNPADYVIFLCMYVATLYVLALGTQHYNYLLTYVHIYIRDMYTRRMLSTMLLYNV